MSEEMLVQLRMVGDSAADFAAAQGGAARARAVHEGGAVRDADTWLRIAELGWFGVAVSEEIGGLGLGAPALCRIAEEAGRQLMMPPLTMAMAAAAVLAQESGASASLLSKLLEGKQHVAMAMVASDGQPLPHAPHLEKPAAGLLATLVPDGDAATTFLFACEEGSEFEVRILPSQGPGIASQSHFAVDGSRLVDVHVSSEAWGAAPLLLRGEAGRTAWNQGRQLLWLGDAAYLSGLMDAALTLALDYLRLRKQFGVPIGSFQALQHRAATCHVDAQATQALVGEAAAAFDSPLGAWAAAASLHRAAAAALRITEEVVQFHGAIAFADEHDAGLYLRRAMALSARHARDAREQLTRPRANR